MSSSGQSTAASPLLMVLAVGGLVVLGGVLLWLWLSPDPGRAAGTSTVADAGSPAEYAAGLPGAQSPRQPSLRGAGHEELYLPEVRAGHVYDFWMWGDEPSPFGTFQVVEREGNLLKLRAGDGLEFWETARELNVSGESRSGPEKASRSLKRHVAKRVLNNARILEAATDQWAIENNKVHEDSATWEQLSPYIKNTSLLYLQGGQDPLGRDYVVGTVGEGIKIAPETLEPFREVTSRDYWGSYAPDGFFEDDPASPDQ
jgi:hypothetical protein